MCMSIFNQQHAGRKHNIKIRHKSFENVTKSKHLGTTLTKHNCTLEEIQHRLKSRNACYHLVQNLVSSHLLSKNIKIKICKTIHFCVKIKTKRASRRTMDKAQFCENHSLVHAIYHAIFYTFSLLYQ
jgi:hypothetical protein